MKPDEKTKETEPTKKPIELAPEKPNLPKPLEAQENGLLVGNTLEDQYRLAKYYVASRILPKQFDTPEKVITGSQYAREVGLKPLTSMRQMAVIQGTPSFYGDLPLAIVMNSKKLVSIKEYIIDEEQTEICIKNKNLKSKVFGAVCIVKRDNGIEKESIFTMDDAQQAGLVNRDCWKHYTKTMLKYRARAMALKDLFPDVLNGISIAEYDHNEIPMGDNGVVVATTEEVQDHIDKTMSDYKITLMHDVTQLFNEMEFENPEFNQAKQSQMKLDKLGTKEIQFATEANLEALKNQLTVVLEGIKAKNKELENEEPKTEG